MAKCKVNVAVGKTHRYMRKCDVETKTAVVFSTALDEGYIVTTQMPVCEAHREEKIDFLEAMGTTCHVIHL